ncbi:DUF1674 domain-containing protein [Mesorhizobium sp. CAU 1732]|uniref:DUF1674 domain-containing protein n=1 Tax=Mesorhizobium sp. CAU 1732 TaxID=3140358 RepID=UPI00325FEAD6
MNTKPTAEATEIVRDTSSKTVSPAARRALDEAEARRREALQREAELPTELGGRGGKDPVRYGDWEVKGMACDF